MKAKTKEEISDEVRYCSHRVELKRGEEGDAMPTIRGYAAKFNVLSEFMYGVREKILPGAFDNILNDDVRALVNHEGIPMARTKSGTLSIGVDDVGLWYEFVPANTETARELIEALDREDIDQSSFRFSVSRKGYEYVEDDKDGTVREISNISRLRDVSVVTFPAYPDASAEMKRSFDEFQQSQTPEDEEKRSMTQPIDALNVALEKLAEL